MGRSSIISVVFIALIMALSVNTSLADSWTYFTTENSGLGSDTVTDIFFTDDGKLWFVHDTYQDTETTAALSGYSGSGWLHIEIDDFPLEGYPSTGSRLAINEARPFGNTILIATNQGLFRYYDNDVTRVEEFANFSILSAYIRDDTIWASGSFSAWGRNTISFTNGNSVETFYTGQLNFEDYHRILGFDSDGNLWTSGGSGRTRGLYCYDGEYWKRAIDDGLYEGMRSMPDGSLWFWKIEDSLHPGDSGFLIFDGEEFEKTDMYFNDLDWSVEGETWLVGYWVWSVIKDGMVYEYDFYRIDELFDTMPDIFDVNMSIAADDTTIWIGSKEYGVLQISKTFLESLNADTSEFATEVIDGMRNPEIGYGDDYYYYPMHIGDTWTYERTWQHYNDMTYHDSTHRTIIDTVWVDGEMYFEFLDGGLLRSDADENCVYGTGGVALDFRSLDVPEYSFGNSYYPRRLASQFDLPAGQFTGYIFSYMDVYSGVSVTYGVIPGIGQGTWEYWTDYGAFENLELVSACIAGKSIDEIVAVEEPTPATFDLAAYPNPFNPRTTIAFTTLTEAPVTLAVYSVTGQNVATLVDGLQAAGTHMVTFDGSGLASGVYLIHLEAGNTVELRKVLLMK